MELRHQPHQGTGAHFGDFDCAFAEASQLPVETGDDYAVTAPLGLDWYDDGSWDRTTDTAG